MEVLLGVLIAIAGLLGIAVARLLTTFIHEIGHALSALLLCKGNIKLYVGSYGDKQKNLKVKMGRLTLFLSYIVWHLDIGLSTWRWSESNLKNFIIIMSGPLVSLLLGIIFLYLITFPHFSDGEKFLLAIFMISFFWDFFVNLLPGRKSIKLEDGSWVQNDGGQLWSLVIEQNTPEAYKSIEKMVDEGKYKEALKGLDDFLVLYPKKRNFYELKLDLLYEMKDYPNYLNAFDQYSERFDLAVKHIDQWAEIKIKMHGYDEVIETLTNIIYHGKGNYNFHFKRGKALMELGEYTDAMRDFHALTLGDKEDPRALANRAYCQYKLGYGEEAREDVLEALESAESHQGEINFLAGVIFEDTDEDKALKFYKKAVDLEYDHHALAFNISRIEKFK